MKINNEIKVFLGVILALILTIIGIIIYKNMSVKEYSKNYFYMDTYINVKLYTFNEKKANEAFELIDNLYQDYHNLTDKYNDHPFGLYELNKEGNTYIDYRLYKIIEYGYEWQQKSNGLLDISIGNVTDIWKKYREEESGVPSIDELKNVTIGVNNILINGTKSEIEDMKINNSIILSNGVTIDLGAISKGYVTEEVGNLLNKLGLNKFIINAGGNVLVGDYYKKGVYKIGIESPEGNGIYKIVKGNNIAVVTSGGYQRNYTYNGVTYNHIIDPNTLYPANNMLSVTVISKSSKEADALSTTLFLMSYEDGIEFIKDYNAEAIWYLNDGTIKTTDGIKNYE